MFHGSATPDVTAGGAARATAPLPRSSHNDVRSGPTCHMSAAMQRPEMPTDSFCITYEFFEKNNYITDQLKQTTKIVLRVAKTFPPSLKGHMQKIGSQFPLLNGLIMYISDNNMDYFHFVPSSDSPWKLESNQ